jgi:hypothetical protein
LSEHLVHGFRFRFSGVWTALVSPLSHSERERKREREREKERERERRESPPVYFILSRWHWAIVLWPILRGLHGHRTHARLLYLEIEVLPSPGLLHKGGVVDRMRGLGVGAYVL